MTSAESGFRKTNPLPNLINQKLSTDKIYLYAKGPYETKYQFLINKPEDASLKHYNGSKAFIEYSNDMDYIYENIEEYNPDKERKISIIFDDVLADMVSNKKVNPIVTELLITGRKLNISFGFYHMILFCCTKKNIRLYSTNYFIMKVPNKPDYQQIVFNH